MFKYIVLLGISLLVSSCATRTVTVTKNHYVALPEYYLSNCDFPSPPEKREYAKLAYHEKERLLVNIYLAALNENVKCNTRLTNARKYREDMLTLYRSEDSNDNNEDVEDTAR